MTDRTSTAPAPQLSAPGTARLQPGSAPLPLSTRLVLRAFEPLARGHLALTLPDHSVRHFGKAASPTATVHLHVHRPAFFKKCIHSGDIGFAESYIDGDWSTPDLTALISWFLLNHDNAPTLSGSRQRSPLALNLLRLVNRLGHLLRPNSLANARRNIHAHYDLSNDFFALFLDPTLMYSSAKWAHPAQSLEQAQHEKNDALCRHLRLSPGDSVLEIGTGWGGWALHAAENYGCRVTTLTLSTEQADLARRRIADAGLGDRIEVKLQDYRSESGHYDKIVSIEMLEAVGHRYHAAYFATINRLLKPHGLLALQYITCPDHRYNELRRGVDFIQKHVFPGSLLLSPNRVNSLLSENGGFILRQHDDFGPDYARTLRHWTEAFEQKLDQVRALGFDDRFIRKWRYYLAYCEAAFAARHISVVHTIHSRANNPLC